MHPLETQKEITEALAPGRYNGLGGMLAGCWRRVGIRWRIFNEGVDGLGIGLILGYERMF